MISRFEQLRRLAGDGRSKTVAVACAHDTHTLEAVLKAREEGLLRCILVGREDEIRGIAGSLGHALEDAEVRPAGSDQEAAELAVALVRSGEADFIQKGLMQTSTILKAVVNREHGLYTGRIMSHVALLEIPGYHKLLGVTDGGMIPDPDLETKRAIVRNAVEMFHRLGCDRPVVSALCAAETVSPKIRETVDAQELKKDALAGALGECYVEGPISLDLALDRSCASVKGYDSPACGETDILLTPGLTAGNSLVKGLLLFAGAKMAGCVVGPKCPVALNSRGASFEEKYYSLLACAYIS